MPTLSKKSRAKIRTSLGDMELEFLADKAPRTVDNFLNLVHKGFYDGLTFHRVVKDFVAQGGCPKGDGSGGPGYTIRPEFNDTPHVQGTVSMARSADPHSAGSQFFICLTDARYLDSRYTAFARVVGGLDVLEKMSQVPVNMEMRFKEASSPRDPIYINGIDLTDVEFDEPVEREPAPDPAAEAPATDQPKRSRAKGRNGKGEKSGSARESEDDAPEEADETEAAKARSTRKKTSRRSSGAAAKKSGDDAEAATEDAPKAKKSTRARSTKKTSSRSKDGGSSTRGRKTKGAGKDDEE